MEPPGAHARDEARRPQVWLTGHAGAEGAVSEARTQPCPECGGEMRFEEGDDEVSYRGRTRAFRTLGWWCTQCGEGILTGEPLRLHEVAYLQLKAEVDGA